MAQKRPLVLVFNEDVQDLMVIVPKHFEIHESIFNQLEKKASNILQLTKIYPDMCCY